MIAIRAAIIAIGLIIIWQLVVMVFHLPPYILPTPLLVLHSFFSQGGLILSQLWPTLIEAVIGLLLALFFGVIAALNLMYFRPARMWFLPVLLISQALPTFAIAPLFVMWFGYGMASKIATTILMVFFPITSSFYDGLLQTPKTYLDLAQTMQASRWQTLWRVQLPAALPNFASGLRMAAVYAPMGAVIGEWVGASRGIGYLILNANSRMQIALMFAALIALIVMTLVFYYVIDKLSRYFVNWSV